MRESAEVQRGVLRLEAAELDRTLGELDDVGADDLERALEWVRVARQYIRI
jgi:hypothetical protein